jgi:hypothetical protein
LLLIGISSAWKKTAVPLELAANMPWTVGCWWILQRHGAAFSTQFDETDTVSPISTVENGSPPVSHNLSILDGNLFATFQHETSLKTLKSLPSNKQYEACELLDQSRKLWLSKK